MNVNSKSDHFIEKFLHQYVYDTTCKTKEKNVTRLVSIKQPYVHNCTEELKHKYNGKKAQLCKIYKRSPSTISHTLNYIDLRMPINDCRETFVQHLPGQCNF
jgi:hypothetical protein